MNASLFDLKDRTALVTGASRGLGRRFARALSRSGARVIGVARRLQALEDLKREIEAEGGSARAHAADLTRPSAVRELFQELQEDGETLHVVVNCAGIFRPGTLQGYPESDWDDTMAINLRALWLVCQAAVQHMRERAVRGSIINVSSVLAHRVVDGGDPAYTVSKAAVEQLTRKLASMVAREGIRVNALAPGWFPTELNRAFLESDPGRAVIANGVPMARTGGEHELDGPLLFLASDASTYATGHVLQVDGGLACNRI